MHSAAGEGDSNTVRLLSTGFFTPTPHGSMSTHTYSMVISYTAGSQFAQNVLHYQFDDGGYTNTSDAAFDLCNAFDLANTAPLKSILSTHVTINSYKGRALNVGGGFEGIKLNAGPPAGTRGGNYSASGLAPVVVLYPNGNAPQRGRIFLPGISDADCIGGEFQGGFITAFNAAAHIFKDTLTLAGGGAPVATPVIYSRKPIPATSRVVDYVRLSPMLGTQRRRQRPA